MTIKGPVEVGRWRPGGGPGPTWYVGAGHEVMAACFFEDEARAIADALNAREAEREELALARAVWLADQRALAFWADRTPSHLNAEDTQLVAQLRGDLSSARNAQNAYYAAHPERLEVRADA